MTLYVDGDAFPNLLKPILFRAITKHHLKTIVFANKKIDIGKADCIEYKVVALGANEADNKIVDEVQAGDLVITADIPLADRVISKQAHALDHRGELFTQDNIKERLAVRDLMQNIRDMGEITKGPAPFSQKDCGKFANALNAFLQKPLPFINK